MPPISRRAALTGGLLGGGALVLGPLTGCSDVRFVTGPEATPTAERGADDDARDALVADALDLLGRATTLAADQPAAQRVVDACTAHLLALGEPSRTVATPPAASETAAQALADTLAAAAGRALALVDGVSGGTARLAVSVGASRAVLLDTLAASVPLSVPDVPVPTTSEEATAPTPTTSTTPARSDDPVPATTAALQRALAGEHAAVHGYGLVVGRVGEARRAEAYGDLDAHRTARDALVDDLTARGADPDEALTSYDASADTPEAAALLAASVEDRLAGVYADTVVAGSTDRVTGAAGVLRSARAARRWGSSVTSFPGLAELAEDGTPVPTATVTATPTTGTPTTSSEPTP